MLAKHTVTFPTEGAIELSACLFIPEGLTAPAPAITMAHGYGGTKDHGLERMARAFAEAGFVVLHDHRGFGNSGGEPRQDINPWQQITDWRSAISYLQDRPEVDENRIGLWGTSYAGGHAIVLGATDRRLKAIVSQVPTIDGPLAGARRVPPEAVAGLEERFAQDDRGQLRGEPLRRQMLVSADAADMPSYRQADAVSFYLQPVPEGVWENQATLRSTRWARMYQPGLWVARVSPTPLLMIVAKHDHVAATDLALAAYEQALEPKRLALIEGGHFDPYLGEFEASSSASIAWFTAHL